MQLQTTIDERLKTLGTRANDARKVISSLYSNPVTDASKVTEIIEKSNVSGYKLIALLEEQGILKEVTGSQRGKIYIFDDYIKLFHN